MTDFQDAPLLSSTPGFSKLRPEVMRLIDQAEQQLRLVMQNLLENGLRLSPEVIAEAQQQVVIDMPAAFMRALLPMMEKQSELMDQIEMLQGMRARGGKRTVN